MRKCVLLMLAALLLSGCTVTPAVSQPDTGETTAPATTVTTAASSEESGATDITTDQTTSAAPTTDTADPTAPVTKPSASTAVTTKQPTVTTQKPSLTADEIYKNLKRADRDCEAYDFQKYTAPYWEGNVVYNESVMALQEPDGSMAPITLMYPADRILAVHDAMLNKTYVEGRDYALQDGQLVILPGSSIKTYTYDSMYSADAVPGWLQGVDGVYQFFAEGAAFHRRQLAVSYIHTAAWDGPVPVSKSKNLPDTLKKLQNGENVSIVFFGCSTSLGGNSSGHVGVEPYAPSWTEMTVSLLEKAYPKAVITPHTVSKGGQIIAEGLSQIGEVNSHKPDLVIMEFGMNEGAHKYTQQRFVQEISQAMEGIRKENPDCEFLLMSSWCPNRTLKSYDWPEEPFMSATVKLEGDGVAVGDWWSLHDHILQRKRYCDMTGNNVNHPNDFLARLMAQTVYATIVP